MLARPFQAKHLISGLDFSFNVSLDIPPSAHIFSFALDELKKILQNLPSYFDSLVNQVVNHKVSLHFAICSIIVGALVLLLDI